MSNQRLAGKRVLVVGAASGIGRATALQVTADGASAALIDWEADAVAQAADECAAKGAKARSWQCDVSDAATVADVVSQAEAWLSGLDVLIHVAGISGAHNVQVEDVDNADWDRILSVNLTGTFNMIKHATPHLEKSHGTIIMTGSSAGVFVGHQSTPYAASKGAMNGLMIQLEGPLRERGIRINNVAPAGVDTPLLRKYRGGAHVDARRAAGFVQPAEAIASIMAFLASDDADAVRGVVRTW